MGGGGTTESDTMGQQTPFALLRLGTSLARAGSMLGSRMKIRKRMRAVSSPAQSVENFDVLWLLRWKLLSYTSACIIETLSVLGRDWRRSLHKVNAQGKNRTHCTLCADCTSRRRNHQTDGLRSQSPKGPAARQPVRRCVRSPWKGSCHGPLQAKRCAIALSLSQLHLHLIIQLEDRFIKLTWPIEQTTQLRSSSCEVR